MGRGLPGALEVTIRSPRTNDVTNYNTRIVATWSLPIYAVTMRSFSVGQATGDDDVIIQSRIADALGIRDGEKVKFTFNQTGDTYSLKVKIKDNISSDAILHDLGSMGLIDRNYPTTTKSTGETVVLKPSGHDLVIGMQHMWAGMKMLTMQGHAYLFFDGASRNNPKGPCGYGFNIIKKGDYYSVDNELIEGYCYAGMNRTSNEMEYEGLLEGLIWATRLDLMKLTICGDSKLIIDQITDKCSTNNEYLIELKHKVKELLLRYGEDQHGTEITFQHVRREENQIADNLANRAIVTKKNVINVNWINVNKLMGGSDE